MRARIAAVALIVLSLCGCVAEPPAGPSSQQIEVYNERMLDETWSLTGLSGEPPAVRQVSLLTMEDWIAATFGCMSDSGIRDLSIEWSSLEGYALSDPIGSVTDEEQRAFYVCVASHGVAESDDLMTESQLDYLYDYYQEWLVPCMVMEGFTPSSAPSRLEFHELTGHWSPYYSADAGLTPQQYEQIELNCGPERPRLY